MGSGGISGEAQSTTTTDNNMVICCDDCGNKFSFRNRKKQCKECENVFCGNCCPKNTTRPNRDRLCARCKTLLSQPPVRADLMELRVKDLQKYLVSKRVNTKACVEKKDLVELVMRQNGAKVSPAPPANSSNSAGADVGRAPIERQKSFPKSYVESTHRHDWMERFSQEEGNDDDRGNGPAAEDEDLVRDFVFVHREGDDATTSGRRANATSASVEDATSSSVGRDAATSGRENSTSGGREDSASGSRDATSSSSSASSSSSDAAAASAADATSSSSMEETPVKVISPQDDSVGVDRVQNADEVGTDALLSVVDQQQPDGASAASAASTSAAALPASPRRFRAGPVCLAEIQTLEELSELSAKQMKELLAVNRVNFKGVVEKEELLKIVERLWRTEMRLMKEKDTLEDSELCKICMDNPVDCVMLECGHMCTCIKCGKQMNECPMCRQYVVRVVKTFKS